MDKLKILVLEDTSITQHMIDKALSDTGIEIEITYCENVAESLAKMSNKKFDLALLDYYVEDGTALDIIENNTDTPCVVLTSANDQELAASTLQKGAKDFIIKDSKLNYLEKLREVIESVIHKS
ncbi:response regulator [Marivirga salinae]|uniref:Response regulator n=1 Tax=Marivirga salinarum TaxID=3059078 RepID=A0AA49JBM0_9BACT|nr:response regulator [Marivirga sp. BDSF4-3]WKK75765.2 response regulator [Marivirga sp. BDSF4-3]